MSDLLKINVNEHTERKGGLTYLSWAWAWAEVLKYDPGATWTVHGHPAADGTMQPCMWVGDTALVQTSVTIKGLRRDCLLPVMDNRNNAVKSPDARKISDAIMRCMTKAIAMHGLGLYIYAGEDLPEGERVPTREEIVRAAAEAAIAKFNAGNEYGAYEEVCSITDTEEMLLLWNIFGKENSALRSSIKKQAAAERERQKAVEQMPSAIEARKAA